MHTVVMESLEEYLAGTLEPVERKAIEAHLSGCEMCSEEVRSMQEISLFLGCLRTEEPVEVSAGFYARVREDIYARKSPSLASLFDVAFGRRLALASLMALAFLGSYLVLQERSYSANFSPDAVMAQQNLPEFDSSAPDNMLVTLTNYER